MTRCDTLSHLGSAQNSHKPIGNDPFEPLTRGFPGSVTPTGEEFATVLTADKVRCSPSSPCSRAGAHCAWLRVAPLLPSPSLRAVAQVLPGRGGKAGLPIELESRPGGIESLARLQNCFSSPHQADPRPHAEPSPLFDPPEAGRMSGCPPSRRFFAATVRRSGQGMKPLRGAHPARVP